jgi:glycosyltransferase involved in cell wall biosynthesis
MAQTHPISVVILTKDEEVNIAACLECLSFSDDIVVYDSFSTDKTVEIAKTFANVRVVQRKFDNWAAHQNWGVSNIPFKHPWVLYVDADERVPPELARECMGAAAPDSPVSAFRMRRKDFLMGTWLRRAQLYPTWLVRFFRPDRIKYERLVNPVAIVDGPTQELQEHIIHYPFSKGLKQWFERHNSYSSFEATELIKADRFRPPVSGLVSGDPNVRRAALKELFYRLPFRPAVRFVYLYLVRRGLLDGKAGFYYSGMISSYEYWIEAKIAEQRRGWTQRTEEYVKKLMFPAGGTPPRAPGLLADGSPLIEVMIPTFNEASHIRETVENAKTLGPVYVLDSKSTDGTQDIAREAGATVVEHPFENYSRQKNWGLEHLGLRGKWTFILDADERVTPELREEILRAAQNGSGRRGYFVNRVVIFSGQKIRHGGLFPSWNLRFFQRGSCRYEDRSVHEHMICDGPTGYLKQPMLHIRRETLSQYIAKHIRYADLEAAEWCKAATGQGGGADAGRLFRDTLRFRQWVRRKIWPKLPFKPLIRIVYMYFLRLGFLDGRAGWHLACIMATYEYMISLFYLEKMNKMRETGTR